MLHWFLLIECIFICLSSWIVFTCTVVYLVENLSRTRRKVSSKAASIAVITNDKVAEPWTVLAHKKPQKDWIPYNPKTMRPRELTRETKFMKLMSWNVNGLRALLKLEGFSALQLAKREDFDVLCLQETKLQACISLFIFIC